jgi:hypothetical protein
VLSVFLDFPMVNLKDFHQVFVSRSVNFIRNVQNAQKSYWRCHDLNARLLGMLFNLNMGKLCLKIECSGHPAKGCTHKNHY